jgi:hypothetical protein
VRYKLQQNCTPYIHLLLYHWICCYTKGVWRVLTNL